MLEGPRRVGKSTIAEEFAKKYYRSYIKVDFSNMNSELEEVFRGIGDLDFFFLRLQAVTGVTLYVHDSVIIFNEIQLSPKTRQAIKHLVADGRYSYIETGSLLSIRKNVKDIVIPSEEHKIEVWPMDYEEFLWATGGNPDLLRKLSGGKEPLGDAVNRKLMRDFRLYMAVGGMPQAVEAYVGKKNFSEIDAIKRKIIDLYEEDFQKIDASGKVAQMFENIPSQLALNLHKYRIARATKKRKTAKDGERMADLLNSRTVLMCNNVTEPGVSLMQSRDLDAYKLYVADTGLFVTMMFGDASRVNEGIYKQLLSDNLKANLGYLYENVAAQMIAASGRKLLYHTWKDGSKHPYEVDFLLVSRKKVVPVEVKSSNVRNHASIDCFRDKYSKVVGQRYLFSQKDVGQEQDLLLRPLYLMPFILEQL